MTDVVRMVVVAQEFPYPPIHGGRADVWRRMQALKKLGVRLALVCWVEEAPELRPSAAEQQAVLAVADILELIPKPRGVRASLLRLARIAMGIPSHAADRAVNTSTRRRVFGQLTGFDPNVVLLDSPYGGMFAESLCNAWRLPMVYRSHNIEHRYLRGQAAAAGNLRNKIAWRLACLHLAGFERRMMRYARLSFDISAEDAAFWRTKGITNGTWLPPLPEAALLASGVRPHAPGTVVPTAEIAFLGNLHAPNNVQGVAWLIEQVMPHVWKQRPSAILTIAGSRPTAEVLRIIMGAKNVELRQDIVDATSFLAAARVLVNPVLSGSGVNVKTLDMLMTDRPIVSTPQGVAGLVPAIQAQCHIASGAESFAQALLAALANPDIDRQSRASGRALFSLEAVAQALNMIRGVIQGAGQHTPAPRYPGAAV